MKIIFTFLILTQFPLILASSSKRTGEKRNKESYRANSQHIKSLISQKSIQNVLETVEILKDQGEMTYRQKKNKVNQKQSI